MSNPSWTPPPADPHAGMVNISVLSPEKKRRIWAHLKQHRPELASMLSPPESEHYTDKKVVSEFQKLFGPLEIWVPLEACGMTEAELRA